MARIAPFAAVRYDEKRNGGDVSALIAPPYDVLDQADKDALLARSDRNIVAIDLPHIPPKSAGPPEAYAAAARRLESWLADGTLIRDPAPALYLYHQTFDCAGRQYTRKKFIARLELRPFSDGVVLPHELTFGGPKEDRLALMKATRCNISPVFGLYHDPEDRVGRTFAATAARRPDVTATLDGVGNRMWIVTDAGTIRQVVDTLADKKVYIADGHHRYGTALNYREFCTQQAGKSLPPDHPAHYVMMVLGSMDDPGSLIIAYNRTLAHVDLATVLEAWKPGTALVERRDPCCACGGRSAAAASPGNADIVLFDGKSGKEVALRFTDRPQLKTLQKGEVEPWYDLDAAYLHRYLIDELLKQRLGRAPDVRYTKSAENTRQVARDEAGVGLLLNPTPMAHLRAVSEAGGLMPQKSTFFYPKLATGLTINPLRP
ncbi:MAG TPA: DUF1015 domain-containing protein [Phycisphaerae bacterium]|nr:DUF1015 domain-containing protein [Phycisphaerae bacterium]HNU46689.1 DUF1015 domain-containing protein [Phycisphaerae bacterium]